MLKAAESPSVSNKQLGSFIDKWITYCDNPADTNALSDMIKVRYEIQTKHQIDPPTSISIKNRFAASFMLSNAMEVRQVFSKYDQLLNSELPDTTALLSQ